MVSQQTELAAMIVRLRTPLLRIELAASQLLRASSTPAAMDLSASISDAVSSLDEQISDVLQAFLGSAPGTSRAVDCWPVIHELHRRIEPVLKARSIEWLAPVDRSALDPVMADRETTRGAALTLLQSGVELAETGGSIALSLESDPVSDRNGVVLRVTPGSESASFEPDANWTKGAEVFAAPRSFVRSHGGELEIRTEDDGVAAIVWLTSGTAPCSA